MGQRSPTLNLNAILLALSPDGRDSWKEVDEAREKERRAKVDKKRYARKERKKYEQIKVKEKLAEIENDKTDARKWQETHRPATWCTAINTLVVPLPLSIGILW
jgi:hypothetical protein